MKAYCYIDQSCIEIAQHEPTLATVVNFQVHPDQRGKGLGKRLMRKTCKDADREWVTLYLEPLPFGAFDLETKKFHPPGLNYDELCAFYQKFGFRFRAGTFKHEMMRKPHAETT